MQPLTCRRLVAHMQRVAILSQNEAIACIRDYRAGIPYGGEAVHHFGGPRAVILAAIRHRHLWRKAMKEQPVAVRVAQLSSAKQQALFNGELPLFGGGK